MTKSLQAVLDVVGPAVSAVGVESGPLYEAERELDGALLSLERARDNDDALTLPLSLED